MFPKPMNAELPLTIEEAVSMLLADLPLLDRTRLSAMTTDDLILVNEVAGLQIAKDFRLWSGNDTLLNACLEAMGEDDENADPTLVIIRAMWKRLQDTHVLRLVK